MRRFALITAPVIATLLLTGLAGSRASAQMGTATPTPTAVATTPPQLPGRFTGTLLLFGKKPSGNGAVTAYIGAIPCGSAMVKSGLYAVNVPAAANLAGCGAVGATVTFKIGDYWATETGTWEVGVPQTLDLTGPKMQTLALVQGCTNNVTLTFSNKTPIKTLRAAIEPATSLTAVWKWNAKLGQWDGDFPSAPDAVNTLKTVDRLDTVWICVSSPANLVEPAVAF